MRDLPGIVRYAKGATQAQYDEARAILEALDFAYPDHPWSVELSGDETGGRVFIRHLAFQGNYGMNVRHNKKDAAFYSSSAFKREVILRAGEWLERMGIPRGRYETDYPLVKTADGVPQKPAANVDAVIQTSDFEVRETPRPQALKQKEKSWPTSST